MPAPRNLTFVLAWPILLMLALQPRADDGKDSASVQPIEGVVAEIDRINLEKNLRWIVQRERTRLAGVERAKGKPLPASRVGVFADAGVWHVGAKSIVDALEDQQVMCRVLDRSELTNEGLHGLEVLVLPGGWAPLQRTAVGEKGLDAIKKFVDDGGRCMAICAGAYLVSKSVKYEGKLYSYPLGLFDGVAEGPLKGLAPFPTPGKTQLNVTKVGRERGLGFLEKEACYYSGGPCFRDGTQAVVLARYHDGSAAIIVRPQGKGEVVLLGPHLERPAPEAGDDAAPPPKYAGPIFKALLFPSRKTGS